MAASEKSAEFKRTCHISIAAPLILAILGFPCAPKVVETIYRAIFVWNALLCIIVLKSPNRVVQMLCVHIQALCICPCLFIVARWWCGPGPAPVWVITCIGAFIWQMNLRFWVNGQWCWMHLTMKVAMPFLAQWHQYHEASFAYIIGRHLSDKNGPAPSGEYSNWIVPMIVTLVAAAVGLVVLYAKPGWTIFRRKAEVIDQPVEFDSFDFIVPFPVEDADLEAAKEDQLENDHKPSISASTAEVFHAPGAVKDDSQEAATTDAGSSVLGSRGSVMNFLQGHDKVPEGAIFRSEHSITSAMTLSSMSSAPENPLPPN